MPVYEYRCSGCGTRVEKSLSMSDAVMKQFCSCGKELERVMTFPQFNIHKTGKDMVLNTLNTEYKILPKKQIEIMAGGLEYPEQPVTGRGFSPSRS